MAARDIIFATVILFAFGTAFFMVHSVFNTTVDKLVNTTVISESNVTVTTFQTVQVISDRLDYVMVGLMIGLVLAIIISGWFIGGNPIFMFIYFLVVVIATVVASVFNYVWEQISTASVFGGVAAFPITNHVLTHLEIYVPVIGFLGLIAMFAKPFVVGE